MTKLEFNYDNGKIDRRFTQEWSKSGIINMDNVPDLVATLVNQRKEMINYIELLHDKIDKLIKDNNICHIPDCHTAGCTSDHK